MGTVIRINALNARSCDTCENAAFVDAGVFCLVYQELVLRESDAANCESYEEGW